MYFNRGNLPWQGLKAPTKKQKYEKISEKKIGTSVEALTKGYPVEFAQYLNYCRSLHFEDKPDYAYLRKLFRELFTKEGNKYDVMFDWTALNNKEDSSKSMNGKNEEVADVSPEKIRTSEISEGEDENKQRTKLLERNNSYSRRTTNEPEIVPKTSSFIKVRKKDESTITTKSGEVVVNSPNSPSSATTPNKVRGLLSRKTSNK